MSPTQQKLNSLREVQGVTGPNYCLASAKFFSGKLVGLYGETKHLYDFLRSP